MKGNILGDIRAENDSIMLDKAFLETSDYKSLLSSSDRCIVVGRRGTGKSALVHKLNQYWLNERHTFVVVVAPDEAQMIGLRGTFGSLGNNFVHIKAASKICWKYALYMEILVKISAHYKLQKLIDHGAMAPHLKEWSNQRQSVSLKLRNKLKHIFNSNLKPEELIADLSGHLQVDDVEDELQKLLDTSNHKIIVLIDRLDEGYTPDQVGIAMVAGFVQSVVDLSTKFSPKIRALVFLRDNMFRSISINDPDFTRNIEGQVIRLHWDDYGLFNLVCNRIRAAYKSNQENNTRLWDTYAVRELKGREGFRLALRLTLYRPRDILVLLNNAFLHASNQNRNEIILSDINQSAKSISENRLYDLHKEYESIFPALSLFTSALASGPSELSISNAQEIINKILSKSNHELSIQRDLVIFENSTQVIQRLYGIGFIGVFDEKSSSFIFCHDGRDPAKEISANSRILIHPCYWMALNLTEKTLDIENAENIYDEYDIEVSSITEEQRQSRIGSIIEEIKLIEPGHSGCHSFEEWCATAINLLFAGILSNIELHPNKAGRQQRDIVATNMASVPVWQRIYQDYGTRQVIFEIKNYENLSEDDYRQMNTYLCNEYGRIGFIITRAGDNNLERGKELDWAQEIYFNQGKKIIIKISEKYLVKHLSKLRSPQKHDSANIELNKLLDTYIRQYLIIKAK